MDAAAAVVTGARNRNRRDIGSGAAYGWLFDTAAVAVDEEV